MGILIIIVLIIILVVKDQKFMEQEIIYRRTIEALKKENQMLRAFKDSIQNQNEEYASKEEKTEIIAHPVQQTKTELKKEPIKEAVKEAKAKRKALQKDVIKNNAILALGSMFIVVAAISFLYTGWDVLHNALKIGVLGILAVVFLLLSHLSKHKLNLPQTAKAFFYIAMGYIPIVFFSLSLLDLIGEYFSISGDGRFIYLFAASTFIMSLYYVVGNKLKDYKMQIAAHCMQTVVLIFGLLAMKLSSEYIGLFCIIHTLIFNILIGKVNDFKVINKMFGLCQAIAYTVFAISTTTLISDNMLYLVILNTSIMGLYYLLNMKFEKIPFKYVGHIFQTVVLLLVCQFIDLDFKLYPIAFLIHSLIFNNLAKNYYATILFTIYGVASLTGVFLYWGTFTSLAVALLYVLNSIMIKANTESEKIGKATLVKSLGYFAVLVASFLNVEIAGNTYCLPWIAKEIIWLGIILLTTVVYFKKPNMKFAKNGLLINYICLVMISFIAKDVANILIPANIFTLLGFGLVLYALKVVDLKEKHFIGISALLYTLFRFLIETSLVAHFIYLGICALSLFVFETKKDLNMYRYIPLIAYFLKLYIDGLELFYDVLIVPIVLSFVMLIGLEILSFTRLKKNEAYVIMSFFYTLLPFMIMTEPVNEYLILSCMIVWALINLIVTIDNLRIAVKSVLAFSLFLIYNMLINDFAIGLEVVLTHFGLIVFMLYITRSLFGKRVSIYKFIEYIGLICIYLTAMESVTTPVESLVYLGMLTLFVIVGYKKKLGPLFLTTIIAMVVQLLDLTQEFWLAISGWIYILIMGAILLTFSMRNEKRNQDDRIEIKEKIKAVKEYLDI